MAESKPKFSLDKKRQMDDYLRGRLLFISAMILLLIGLLRCVFDKPDGAIAIFAAAGGCLFFVYLDKFQEIEGLGVKARLRKTIDVADQKLEEVERKIEEAEELFKNLRSVSVTMASMNFPVLARLGRWGLMSKKRQQQILAKEMVKGLTSCGVPREEIDNAMHDFNFMILFDMSEPIRERMVEIVRERSGDEKAQLEESDLVKRLKKAKYQDWPTAVREAMDGVPGLTQDDKAKLLSTYAENIKDIEHYAKHGEIRRPDVWFAGDEEHI